MKKLTLILFVLVSIHVYTQETLLVEYELQRDFDLDKISTANNTSDVKVPESIKSELKKLFTEKHTYTLLLNKTESSFDWIEKINNSQTAGIFANISMGDMGLIYKNLEKNLVEREASVANQNLIIKDTLDTYQWVISKETKEILGYETRKAAAVIDSLTTVEAWYAPKLAFKNGPEYFNGLPGLILEVSKINKTPDGEYKSSKTFLATSLKAEKNQKIEKPKKGKNITKEEYDALVKENRERMNEMRGGGVDVD